MFFRPLPPEFLSNQKKKKNKEEMNQRKNRKIKYGSGIIIYIYHTQVRGKENIHKRSKSGLVFLVVFQIPEI